MKGEEEGMERQRVMDYDKNDHRREEVNCHVSREGRQKRDRTSPPKQGGPLTRIFPFTPFPTRSMSSSTENGGNKKMKKIKEAGKMNIALCQ